MACPSPRHMSRPASGMPQYVSSRVHAVVMPWLCVLLSVAICPVAYTGQAKQQTGLPGPVLCGPFSMKRPCMLGAQQSDMSICWLSR